MIFPLNQKVKAINIEPLKGNTIAPPLELGKEYTIQQIWYDRDKNPHYGVGLKSDYNYITAFETREEIPNGDSIHWCHRSRFEKI